MSPTATAPPSPPGAPPRRGGRAQHLAPVAAHPLVFPYTEAESTELFRKFSAQFEAGDKDAVVEYAAWMDARAERIVSADEEAGDPFYHGFELDHWHHTDLLIGWIERSALAIERKLFHMERLLGHCVQPISEALTQLFGILILLGGNRSGKSEYCAKRCVEACLKHPGTLIVALSENEETSKKNQHRPIWRYLPRAIKALNGKRDPNHIFHLNYDLKGGFTLMKVVFPNRSEILFKTYNQPATDIEGWQLGCAQQRTIGAWPDENCPLVWFETLKRRCRYCNAILLWSYTPIHGMTPTIKQVVGDSARTIVSLPAELLPPDRINVTDCPPGHMPYIQVPVEPHAIVVYFHSILMPFGTSAGRLYDAVRSLCEGKSSEIIARMAYGYTENTVGRAFPMFCGVHIVKRAHLPAVGTNYHLHDFHGERPSPSIWVRVTPGDPPNYYVYRDWPDADTYGEWSVPTERELTPESRKGWDGERGPAQRGLGWGYAQYRESFTEVEGISGQVVAGKILETDPQRCALLLASAAADPDLEVGPADGLLRRGGELFTGNIVEDLREVIESRLLDPLAAKDAHLAEHGGTCAQFEYEDVGLDFLCPQRKSIEHGIQALSALLFYDKTKALQPRVNAPRLYVAEECHQVRWALENYTARGGEEGACKDWIDMLRWMATEELAYINHAERRATRNWSGY